MPKFDVVIPFYNVRIEYTRAAILSVIEQTFTDWRAIVVNDGSCASSTAELEAVIAEINDPRITYIYQNNRGLSGARNAGIRASDSPYVAMLDADDAWLPHKLEHQAAVLKSRPDVALVHGGMDLVYPDHTISFRRGVAPCLGEHSGEQFFLRMLKGNIVSGSTTAAIRRSVAERAGLFDESFRSIEDKEFWLRLIIDGCNFLFLDETLAIYRQHATNMSKNTDMMWRGRMQLIQKLDTLVPALPKDWTNVKWPELRREMLHHAYREAAETCLDSGELGRAWKFSMPWYSGVSTQAALLTVRSVYRLARSVAAGAQ
jgi:glycosyltransferase involved in cell wall biosynthesis